MIFETNANRAVGTSGWHGRHVDPSLPLTIAHCRHGDGEFELGGDDPIGVVLVLSSVHLAERWRAGAWSRRPSRVGNITVTDPCEVTRFAVRGQANVVKLLIPQTQAAAALGLDRLPNVVARFGDPEPAIGRCARRALVALHQGEGSDLLLLSSIALRLCSHLVEQPLRAQGRAVGGLSGGQMRRVKEMIESRASAPVASSPSLGELAAEANLSMHHFAREFRRSTGSTPYGYMLRRRLDCAQQLVVQSGLRLAQVGVLSGFPSPAHFSDRFRREMGVSPGALRRAAQRPASP